MKTLGGLALLLLGGLAVAASASRSVSPPRPGHLNHGQVLARLSANQEGVSFLSFDGQWQGTDTDTRVTFLKNDRVEITDYADGIIIQKGTYSVDSAGAIFVSARNRKMSALYLYLDSRGAFLLPVTNSEGGAYWPFRQTNWPIRKK